LTPCPRCKALPRRTDARFCSACGTAFGTAEVDPAGPAPVAAARPSPQAEQAETARPPGWYGDPGDSGRRRWWDGGQWTWQVSRQAGPVEWAPPPAAASPPAPGLPGLALALAGFAVGVGLGLLVQLILWAAGHPGGKLAGFGLSELGLWTGLVGTAVVVSRRRGTGSVRRDFLVGARPVDLGFGLAGSVAGRAMATVAVLPFAGFLVGRHPSVDQQTFQQLARGPLGWLVVVLATCAGAPLIEELFFRGIIQTRLVGRWGPVGGIAATSALFGAAHLIGWVGPISLLYAWSIAVAGLALGSLRHLTGRLGTSMAAHAMFNAQAMILLAVAGLIR